MVVVDGGQAFPERANDGYGCPVTVGGMTLRDWFAGQALVGLLAGDPGYESEDADSAAEDAFMYADAMLAARSKEAS